MTTHVADKQPLAGLTVLITRAEHQSNEFAEKLKGLGAIPFEMPVIEILPPDSWEELDDAIARFAEYDWIIFASANAITSLIDRQRANALSTKAPATKAPVTKTPVAKALRATAKIPRFAVMGKASEKVAQELGLQIDYKPDSFIAESFVQQFPGYPQLNGLRILWPRTNVGRNYIVERFSAAGATIDVVAAYKTALPKNIDLLSDQIHQLIQEKKIDVITIASTQTAANLASIISHKWQTTDLHNQNAHDQESASGNVAERIKQLLTNVTLLSIGPETSSGGRTYLGKVDLEANPHNVDGMIQVLLQHFATKQDKSIG